MMEWLVDFSNFEQIGEKLDKSDGVVYVALYVRNLIVVGVLVGGLVE